jgi:hypothetical protein
MYAKLPKVAEKYAKETPKGKDLPGRMKPPKKKKY